MEPHKRLSGIDRVPDLSVGPQAYFDVAYEFVKTHYPEQLEAFSSVKFDDVDEDFFFREYVWVVHATGFSAKAVGKFMPRLLQAYGWWDALSFKDFSEVMVRVAPVCNNPQKAKAVYATSKLMFDGMSGVKDGVRVSDPVPWPDWKRKNLSTPELLAKLPYVGKITCFHLARNIGLLECVKPDLHLVRMAKHWGFADCVAMCEKVRPPGMPLGIVDLIFWYAASTFGTTSIRQDGDR